METKIQALKLELIQWLSTIENPAIIEKILAIRNKEKEDWWNQLSSLERESINKGIEEADAGKLNDHKEARNLYEKWL